MKRGTFKRKIGKPMKRTKLRSKGVQTISKVQRELWELCKQIIRKKYGNICFTCGRGNLEGCNWHTGHLFPKASLGAFLKYDLRVLRPQCYKCNINYGGNGAVFIENIRLRDGDNYISEIINDKNKTVKALDHYLKLIEEYKLLLNQLK